jgi:hypothetical protein
MRRRFLYVEACLAGLGSLYWADPDRYGSLLAGQGVPREGAMQDPLPEILSSSPLAGMETQLSDFETYKGIGLHVYQSESRLKVVRH